MKLYFKAPAKINFFLEVINKRDDGYHNLKSVMQTVSLYDELFFELTDSKVLLECKNEHLPHLPIDKENIVYIAAQMLKEYYSINKGARICLKKEIPIKAGLGGGSSDAASTLKALVKLWNIKTSKDKLEKIAAKLSADVPFFLTAGTALCEGIGEIITPLKNIEKLNIVLVNPNFGLSSKDVYKKIKFPLTSQVKINSIISSISNGSFNRNGVFDCCFNRFEEFVFPGYPEIARIKKVLNELGCVSLMSGSGTTVFGIYNNESKTEKLKLELNKYKWKTWFVNTI
ncbi:MAG: 4-(cytidine 5'-diphospho)-2-C-methyl-D-erythritol kinase [Endomicrobium sp.]|jgi:4-diphosphocytidyl-2-C-methyl-D-erythritol kinase|nr:4-(cytidine 5'-diphospho)-2-C-methyl-D-erythritol kinase [Endomicrobium sp.]